MISGSPETCAATTGMPSAIASIGAIGRPSQREGSTSAPDPESAASASLRGSAPSSSTAPLAPSSARRARNSACMSPPPITRKR